VNSAEKSSRKGFEVRALKYKVIIIAHSGGLTPYAEPLGTRDACMAANINGETTASRADAKKQAVNIRWQCEMYERWARRIYIIPATSGWSCPIIAVHRLLKRIFIDFGKDC